MNAIAPAIAGLPPTGWNDVQARFYADTIAASDYGERIAPLLGGPFADVLDIGAGCGSLVSRTVADGGWWTAVEPQAAMRDILHARRPALARRGIQLETMDNRWQDLPGTPCATVLVAANVGATHHEAARFFDAMSGRWQSAMHWVVAAQAGPSTFCLAGFLPASLHGADMQPAVERTMDQLGPHRRPQRVQLADWVCRHTFADVAQAQAHFADRMALASCDPLGKEVLAYIARHGRPVATGFEISCAKRSAVLSWSRPRPSRAEAFH